MLTESLRLPGFSVTRAAVALKSSHQWIRKGVLAITDQTLISGSNFLINVLLARWLGARQYGVYALAYSIFLFLSGFHSSLLAEPMSVFGPARYRSSIAAYVRQLVKLHLWTSLILIVLGVAAVQVLIRPAPAEVVWVLVPVFLLVPLFLLLRRAAYLQRDPRVGPTAAVIYNVLAFSALAAVRTFGTLGVVTAFLTQSLGALGAGAYLFWKLRALEPAAPAQPELDVTSITLTHWNYGMWACATNVVYWLSGEAYVALIGVFLRVEDVAALRALQNLAAPFPQLISALSLLLLPQASAAFADEGIRGLHRVVMRTSALVAAGALCYFVFLLVFGRGLVSLLYAGKYAGVSYLLPVVAASFALTAVAQALLLGLRGMQAPSAVFRAYVAASVVTVVAGAALTRFFGLSGAVAGALVTSMTLVTALACQYGKSVAGAYAAG